MDFRREPASPASPGRQLLGALLDYAILLIGPVLVCEIFSSGIGGGGDGEGGGAWIVLVLLMAPWIAVVAVAQIACQIWRRRTLAHWLLGLRIAAADGGRPGAIRVLGLRSLGWLVSMPPATYLAMAVVYPIVGESEQLAAGVAGFAMFFGLAYLECLGKKRRTLGDHFAGTVIVHSARSV